MKTNYIKYLFIVLIASIFTNCSNDDANEEFVTLNIKHYTTTAVGLDLQFTLLVQEGDDPTFGRFFNGIEGFDYELGFNYELLVRKSDVANPPADGSSIRYELINIVNKTSGSTTETFDVWLATGFSNSMESFVTGDTTLGFELLNTIPIDCNSICDELMSDLEEGERLFGTFTRNNNNEYVLISTNIQ
ncbi:DUF4377 domain-containing protein [uncultured Dokdonia sp.]|uniref:DUF4377 domain-containing protein n=1 Tax=uncultured Dokdonia sp. TaxID=575653 RepID=UPI002612CA1D|nr:DUF4377 domain-containing protein [uncultured Dokdonia sp.]